MVVIENPIRNESRTFTQRRMTMRLSFGLNLTARPQKRPLKSVFSQEQEEEAEEPIPRKASVQNVRQDEAGGDDLADYDSYYDSMRNQSLKVRRHVDSADRKPRYMNDILAAAELRKKEQLLVEERNIQRERAEEGDAYEGKERFITAAYKEHMEELRKHDEAQKKRDEAHSSANISLFYRKLLEERTDQTVPQDADANPNSSRIPLPEETDQPGAMEAAVTAGKRITLNDDQQVVDKRELLNAGLNVSKRSAQTRVDNDLRRTASSEKRFKSSRTHVSEKSRIANELELQWMDRERKQQEIDLKQREEFKATMKRKTTEEVALSAKERYLQRLASRKQMEE